MSRRNFSLYFKIVTLLSLATGLFFNTYGRSTIIAQLSYYTSMSNIYCFIAYIFFTRREILRDEKKDGYYMLKGSTVIIIMITFLIYHLALAPTGFEMEALETSIANRTIIKSIANEFVHTISPILVISDHFLFDERGHFKMFYPFVWTGIPLLYVGYVYMYAALGGSFYAIGGSKKFAYFFLDYTEIGVNGVVKWLVLLGLAVIGLSYVLVMIDSKGGDKDK